MVTDRDQQILIHMEKYKYATIDQLSKIFCPFQKSGYNIIRRRMVVLRDADYIKINKEPETNKLVYMWNEKKLNPPSKHRLILLDVLAELYAIGVDVQLFEVENFWMEGKIRTDGLTVFTINNENAKARGQYFIEVHIGNKPFNLNRFDKLFESGEVQKYLNRNIFPRVLLITDRVINEELPKQTQVIRLNTNLNQFATIVLPPKLASLG